MGKTEEYEQGLRDGWDETYDDKLAGTYPYQHGLSAGRAKRIDRWLEAHPTGPLWPGNRGDGAPAYADRVAS
jgi:hypothetical protein